MTVSSGVKDGLRRVRRYHRNRMEARRRATIRRLAVAISAQKRRVRVLKTQADLARRRFEKSPDLSRWQLWNSFAIFKFTLILFAMFALMGASATSVSVLLRISSEFADFPIVCAAVSGVVVFCVVGVKFALEQFKTEAGVRRVAFTLSGITLVLALAYCVLLAEVTGGFGRQIVGPEFLPDSTASGAHQAALCKHLMWVQMWLEVFAGLNLFSFAQVIYMQHRAQKSETPPETALRGKASDEAAYELRIEESKLEALKTASAGFPAARNEYVEKAAALYLAKCRAAQSQRAGLDAKAGKPAKDDAPKITLINRVINAFRN